MSRIEKVREKLLNPGSILTFQELEYLLIKLGYLHKSTGKTSGSRKAYIHKTLGHIIRIHKPHPQNEIKVYVKHFIITELKNQKLI